MKKRQLFLYALSLSVSAAALGGVSVFADSDYSSQTITAKVTGIDGSSVDLQVGELNLPEKPDDANNGMDFFTAGDDTLTLDFADTEILVENGNDTEEGSLDDIAADSILSIEFDENGDVAQVTVLSTRPDGMGGNGEIGAPDGFGGPGGSGAPGENGAPDGSGAPGGNGAPGGFGGSGWLRRLRRSDTGRCSDDHQRGFHRLR